MRQKLIVGAILAIFLICATGEGVSAYAHYNPYGPDRVLYPGYQWTVKADTAADQTFCLRWAVNQTRTWSHERCVKADTSTDVWTCTIPEEFSNSRVYYQFYKGWEEEHCDPTGNTWELTPQHSFETNFDVVTLNRLNRYDPFLLAGLVGLLWVSCGAIVIIWRHYKF